MKFFSKAIKGEFRWLHLIAAIALCNNLAFFTGSAAICGFGAVGVALWLVKIWKSEQRESIRSEFREMRLTGDGLPV